MIVGPDWIWLHFPKCGGTTAEKMLRLNFGDDPGVSFDEIDLSNIIWHENIPRRKNRDPEFWVEGKRIVAILRRLPDWLLSRVHFEASRPPHHITSRAQLVSGHVVEKNGDVRSAESYFEYYSATPGTQFIRLEEMHEDFEAFFGRKLAKPDRDVNLNKFSYIRDVNFWFTRAELEELYRSAPKWAAAEEKLYGQLLV